MFRELDDTMQIEVGLVLSQFPRLVGEKKLRTSADPFVIALARIEGLQLVNGSGTTRYTHFLISLLLHSGQFAMI